MARVQPINKKARRVDADTLATPLAAAAAPDAAAGNDVVALQQGGAPTGPNIPLGCSFVFSPGWEVDSSGGTAGLCQPVERDLYDCYITCFWPVHVPDLYNHAPDWTAKCAAAQKDWRKIDLIFP
ncbi:MAG: quinohemoprotein amine dehydrogenase [Gemmatimonadetes bacterium]|nr:quinohemoprotein amine dehydrogenase [Gemmatimonadota bacterium]